MAINPEFQKHIAEGGKFEVVDLTPELKDKIAKTANEIMLLLRSRFTETVPAYMTIKFVLDFIQDKYGIVGGGALKNTDLGEV